MFFFHTLAVKALHRLLIGVTRVLPLVILWILLTFYVVGMFVGQQCMMNRTLDMHGKTERLTVVHLAVCRGSYSSATAQIP